MEIIQYVGKLQDGSDWDHVVMERKDYEVMLERIGKLQSERDNLREALENLIEATLWCGGSSDFSPEGKACQGWINFVIPRIEKARKALTCSTENPNG